MLVWVPVWVVRWERVDRLVRALVLALVRVVLAAEMEVALPVFPLHDLSQLHQ
jgi:hypothetical protein